MFQWQRPGIAPQPGSHIGIFFLLPHTVAQLIQFKNMRGAFRIILQYAAADIAFFPGFERSPEYEVIKAADVSFSQDIAFFIPQKGIFFVPKSGFYNIIAYGRKIGHSQAGKLQNNHLRGQKFIFNGTCRQGEKCQKQK